MQDKAEFYASATPDDISATQFEVIEGGKLWRGWAGTVYDRIVATERGHKFMTLAEAIANAELFVSECRRIVRERNEH